MDLEMPKLGGLSAATRIKTNHPDIRIIAFTIHDSPATRYATVQAGMDSLISKGASISQVVKEVYAKGVKNDPSDPVIE
jgi:DNA-binding NarL/FixJ family response regulator